MASPQSGAENAATKSQKDRNCPFCQQAFTSSSLGRHLDLYIKPKNPKPPDGIHDVDEIRKLRGSITRRQSRVASIKRDSLTPAGPASARYILEDKATSSPDSIRKVNWTVNKPGWEATGVMNDLPPRLEPRPKERRESSRREQLKADLDQRQKLADELDTGRAAQLALKEVLDTVRNAEASATGRHLFDDFDFFQQSFPALCIRLLSPSAPVDPTLCIHPRDSWTANTPWDQQRDALSRAVEERGQLLRRKDSLLSSASDDASSADLDLGKFHQHINHVFSLWSKLPEQNRQDAWQREIIRGYSRLEKALKKAQTNIDALKRDAELLATRLERSSTNLSPYQQSFADRLPQVLLPLSPLGLSDDVLRDLNRYGVNSKDWSYEKLLDRWKNVVRDERRATNGLQAQRQLSTNSPTMINSTNHLSASGAPISGTSRSFSVASAMSATAPSRTGSMDSAQDADAEGEEEDMEADGVAPDAHSYAHKLQDRSLPQPQVTTQGRSAQPAPFGHHSATNQGMTHAYPLPQIQLDQNYKWPQPAAHHNPPSLTTNAQNSEPNAMKRLPPGPDSWHAEFHHAAAHSMDGLEGPASAGARTTTSSS